MVLPRALHVERSGKFSAKRFLWFSATRICLKSRLIILNAASGDRIDPAASEAALNHTTRKTRSFTWTSHASNPVKAHFPTIKARAWCIVTHLHVNTVNWAILMKLRRLQTEVCWWCENDAVKGPPASPPLPPAPHFHSSFRVHPREELRGSSIMSSDVQLRDQTDSSDPAAPGSTESR